MENVHCDVTLSLWLDVLTVLGMDMGASLVDLHKSGRRWSGFLFSTEWVPVGIEVRPARRVQNAEPEE
jgi:hypothetical protein